MEMHTVLDLVNVDQNGHWIPKFLKRTHDGYALIRRNGKSVRFHRFVYECLVGPIGEGLVIDHLCAIRECCNPEHLEAVTISVNAKRQWERRKALGLPAANKGMKYTKSDTCKRGHVRTETNTRWYKRGYANCRDCERLR